MAPRDPGLGRDWHREARLEIGNAGPHGGWYDLEMGGGGERTKEGR